MLRVVLLMLDEQPPLDQEAHDMMIRYLQALLCVEVEIAEVPELPIAPKGWRALHERLRRPLRNRPGRPGATAERQLFAPQLLDLLKEMQENPKAVEVPAAEGAACVLAITGNEFFRNSEGVLPDDPVPEDRTMIFSAASAEHRVGAVSVARLDGRTAEGGPLRRKYIRQLLTLMSHSFLELLKLRECQSNQCLAYLKPFSREATSLNLCCSCEESLLRLTAPRGDAWDQLVTAAADRYRDVGDALEQFGKALEPIKLSRRIYIEFEEEIDWLRVAEEILRDCAAERRRALPGNSGGGGGQTPEGVSRRRSLLNCLRCAHDGQPHRTLKRTFSSPMLKRTCLLDMTQSAPHRHECGDLSKWSSAVFNRKHGNGGHYVELGGSLRQKKIGSFIDSGLNASLAPSGQERLKTTLAQMPITWREQRGRVNGVEPPGVELPRIMSRTRVLERC